MDLEFLNDVGVQEIGHGSESYCVLVRVKAMWNIAAIILRAGHVRIWATHTAIDNLHRCGMLQTQVHRHQESRGGHPWGDLTLEVVGQWERQHLVMIPHVP